MEDHKDLFEVTLDDEIWKDSFDRLLNKRSLLRELKIIKTDVRPSFNNDSSVEVTESNISQAANLQVHKNEKRRISESISTPILINKTYGPFDCPLSPISSWRLTHYNQRDAWESSCKEKSTPLRKVHEQSIHTSTSSCEKMNFKENMPSKPSICNSIPHIKIINDDGSDKTNWNIINKVYSDISEIAAEDVNVNVILPPGKWRRSLTVWKRINQHKYESLDHNPKNDCNRYSQTMRVQASFINQQAITSDDSSNIRSQLELLKICKQKTILSFSSIYSDIVLRKCRKIGEGTYGEVFLNSSEDGETVLKIIPIEGDTNVNGEPQKTFEQILPEVVITMELSHLRQSKAFNTSGFVFLKNVRCLKGKYPSHLIELWNLYDTNYGSENDHPGMFQESQLYVALEVAYGGKDVEGFTFRNAEQAYSAFLQITFSLAVAEKCLQFEHRDLHLGNILIQPTNEKYAEYVVDHNKINIPTNGVNVTIIDYTLSRMFLSKCYYYNDLSADDELFCARGDYQYDIYRLMRAKLRNNWKTYEPQTNVMWLHYILTKLIEEVKYKSSRSKVHTVYIKRMKALQTTILNHNSAFEFSSKIYD